MSGTLNPYRHQYEVVAPSASLQVLGNVGAVGDFLHRIVINITATGVGNSFSLYDGATVITTYTALPVGIYNYELNMASQNTAWKVNTGASVSVIGIGTFTN